MEGVARRWRMIEAQGSWLHWKELCAERRREEGLMRSFAGRLANMGVARAWGSWVERTQERHKMRWVLAAGFDDEPRWGLAPRSARGPRHDEPELPKDRHH